MVSDFFRAVFFSEEELSLEGFVQRVIDGKKDSELLSLSAFASSNLSLFQQYMQEVTGSGSNPPTTSKSAVLSFIRDMGLQNEYNSFCVEHGHEWSDGHDKDEIREQLVSEKLIPLFNDLQKNQIYLYRDSDHYGIHLTRSVSEQ